MHNNPYLPASFRQDRIGAGNGNNYCPPRAGITAVDIAAAACIPGTGPADCDGMIGFLDANVELGTQTTITITPQDCGIVERLIATDDNENSFQCDDLLIGRSTAFGAVPISLASMKSDATARCMRTAGSFSPGKNVTLIATNFTGADARLSANAHYRKVAMAGGPVPVVY